MDVSFNNVLEGTRQYFMGVPKQSLAEGSGQPVWPADAPPPEEGAPAQSGAPAPSSRPPSAAAAPPPVPVTPAAAPPPRPPSEPLEPEPHIIHKATVMREAAEKRREMPEIDDEEEATGTLSPPSHIIRKPPRAQSSPAPAPAAPCPSPARPPSEAPAPPTPAPEPQPEGPTQYRPPVQRVLTPSARPPDHFAPGRPPDPYPTTRPTEQYPRYHFEQNMADSSKSHHGPVASPQPSMPVRHSPQTYARMSSAMPQHAASRLRETATHSPPSQRYVLPSAQHPPPPHNDRVPPIHHPQTSPSTPRIPSSDSRTTPIYPLQHRQDSPYVRSSTHYERHSTAPSRKYDPQQMYPGYRPGPLAAQPVTNHRVDSHHQVQYKHSAMDVLNTHYPGRPTDRSPMPPSPHPHDTARLPTRPDYPSMSRSVSSRSGYHYQTPSTSTSRYGPSVPVPVVQNAVVQSRADYRPVTAPKSSYNYTPSSSVHTSPARSALKPGYPNQQARMTVSVTSLVNEMNEIKQKRESSTSGTPLINQTTPGKQKRESPLDLSVKTVKNTADSSTTQDDVVDSMSVETKVLPLQSRPTSSSGRHSHVPQIGYVGSHKVDFAPNFTQYGERSASQNYNTPTPANSVPLRYNGSYEMRRPVTEPYSAETSQQTYPNRGKYSIPMSRTEYPKIDLTRPVSDQRLPDSRLRDDRHYIIEDRKRPAGPIDSNIPEKILRYETWTADSRIEHMTHSAREQRELMSRPVYSYSSHKQFEAYRNEQQRHTPNNIYRDHQAQAKHTYPTSSYPVEMPSREPNDYHARYHDRNPSITRHVIQKIPSHRDIHPHHSDPHSGVPADKRVLSILRNSLETKQTGFVEPPRLSKHIPDLIVIDDVDDSVIEITDLTNENEIEKIIASKPQIIPPSLNNHIQMPKAVDSIVRDDYQKYESYETKTIIPENDVASRIRTKAELKVMPPSQDIVKPDNSNLNSMNESETVNKILPKSQKQHLFNQIREDNLRLESVIKSEPTSISELKTEPMNIEEIERDAELSIKSESILENIDPDELHPSVTPPPEDLDWANACDNFMEQLKTGVHKKKTHKKRINTLEFENESKVDPIIIPKAEPVDPVVENPADGLIPPIAIKQEPIDTDEPECEVQHANVDKGPEENNIVKEPQQNKEPVRLASKLENKNDHKKDKKSDKTNAKMKLKAKVKTEKNESIASSSKKEKITIKTVIKEELESTDDDEPLIKSKILKEKEQHEHLNNEDGDIERNERLKYQLLKDLSEKSAYVKLECCDVDVNKNNRKSIDISNGKEKEDKSAKGKSTRQLSRSKGKSLSIDTNKNDKASVSSSDSDDEVTVATRLRVRKSVKNEDSKVSSIVKTPIKSSLSKKAESSSGTSNSSTPVGKPGFGDGSDFHPGWEEELYRYKRSLRMPTRLIAIPRGSSGGPFVRGSSVLLTRGSTSLPDLDPAPLSPAPSSAPSAATDDLYARRQDKHTLDSDLDSNSSCSAPNRLQYDSEASTSTVFSSTKAKRKGSSIVDVLIQKCGRREDSKKKSKDKDEKLPKIIPKNSNTNELLPTPSLGLVKNSKQGGLSAKKEKLMEDIFYLGTFRKKTVTMFRNTFIKNTDGLIGATEEFAPVVLKSRTRTENRVLKQRATIKEVFGDERPASAPPTSCRDEEVEEKQEPAKEIKKENLEAKPSPTRQFKSKKIVKNKLQRRSSSIRDGLRSTKSLKRNDAKGRLLRLKKRNSLIKSLKNKRVKEISCNKHKTDSNPASDDKEKTKEEEGGSIQGAEGNTKRRFKRLFGRRKFSSGFDYIKKKKKIIRKEDAVHRVRRPAAKPNPESVHDIHKEIKGWFINKSIGETHLHRAARLGYTDCVAYCLEKMEADPSAKDNAGFTPLHVAAAKGHVRIARLLLQYGANVSAAAQGGIRPLHEACENCNVEVIRLLLAYGADPLLGTYAGQTPEELTEGMATKFLRLHIADVQGRAVEPWKFPSLLEPIDREELGSDPLSSPPAASPPPPPDSMMEIQTTEAPLPPFYSLKSGAGPPIEGLWCLLQDITNLLQIKSKESLLKQIHCGSGSPKELLREIRTQEFLERAQCHQLLCAGEKVNPRASKVALVRVTDKLRQLLKIETVLVS